MLRNLTLALLVASVPALSSGCLGKAPADAPDAGADPTSQLGIAASSTAGGVGNTFDHDQTQADPFSVLERVQEQGAPEISTRMHSCQKLKYATVGNVLKQLGVDLAKTGATVPSAGQLYGAGGQAMGAPNYAARVAESIELTTAGATKLFDIFVQAAPEVVAAVNTGGACKKAGAAIAMFGADGKFTLDGLSCLQGAPASAEQKALADQQLTEASTPALGQQIAVASILAAAHTCE